MSEEITASYTITPEVFTPAFKWHYQRLFRWKWAALVLFVSAFTFNAFVNAEPGEDKRALVINLTLANTATAVVLYWFAKWLLSFICRRQITKLPAHGLQMDWWITDTGLRSKAGEAEMTLPWTFVAETVSTPVGTLVYLQKNIFNWLPKQAFTTDSCYTRFLSLAAVKTKHSCIG